MCNGFSSCNVAQIDLLVLTVDRNSNDLGQDEAISANEGGNTVEGVELHIVDSGVGRACLDELDVQVISLSDREQNETTVSR